MVSIVVTSAGRASEADASATMRRDLSATEDAARTSHSRGGPNAYGAGTAVVGGMTSIVGRRGTGTPTRRFIGTPGAISSSSSGGGGGGGPRIADEEAESGGSGSRSVAHAGTVCSRRGGKTLEPNARIISMSASLASMKFFVLRTISASIARPSHGRTSGAETRGASPR